VPAGWSASATCRPLGRSPPAAPLNGSPQPSVSCARAGSADPSGSKLSAPPAGPSRRSSASVHRPSTRCCRSGVREKPRKAEWRRGISPRRSHRSGRKPLDLSGSCHPSQTAAYGRTRRAPPVAGWPWGIGGVTHPLRSLGVTPSPRYYEVVRPSPAHRYFRPRGSPAWAFLVASPARCSRSARTPRRESCRLSAGRPLASHQAPARLLPGHPIDPGVGVVAVISTRPRGVASAHLSSHHLTGAPAFSMTLTPGAFDPSPSWRFGASPCRATPKGLPSPSIQPRDAEGSGIHRSLSHASRSSGSSAPVESIASLRPVGGSPIYRAFPACVSLEISPLQSHPSLRLDTADPSAGHQQRGVGLGLHGLGHVS
jgi:hypothetical protein